MWFTSQLSVVLQSHWQRCRVGLSKTSAINTTKTKTKTLENGIESNRGSRKYVCYVALRLYMRCTWTPPHRRVTRFRFSAIVHVHFVFAFFVEHFKVCESISKCVCFVCECVCVSVCKFVCCDRCACLSSHMKCIKSQLIRVCNS